ncbi:alpha/beta hydrolase family protein [Xinfangfangia pollutisoli]|uniref:alpha/beta hydrolase family protein n=1 Tax=Xinfangfangia pollutisoli TaxID=2865960 RepID=UPI001CD3C95D|nr:hypothetical protein [Xinfangfangia pollutisoli]
MKRLLAQIATSLVLIAPALALPCAADPVPGHAVLTDDTAPDRPLSLSLWYPAQGGDTVPIGGNAVFEATPAVPDARVPGGRLPLILLSHGGLRSAADSGAWLAAALAAEGFLVVEVNAPAPATAAAAVDEIWQRRRDIRRGLDRILADPVWSGHVDPGRISVLGFALGGTAALSLAGAAFDPEAYLRACSGPVQEDPDCAWFAAQSVTMDRVDQAELGRPGADSRIAFAVAIAPEYLKAFPAKAQGAALPALIMTLGPQPLAGPPPARQIAFPRAQTADAFALCTQAGAQILRDEGEDPALCGQDPGARAESHAALIAAIRDALAGARP